MKPFSKVYAQSFFSLCEEEKLTEVIMEDLRMVSSLFESNEGYAPILDSPTIPFEERLSLINDAFSSFHEYTQNFIKILCEKKCVFLFSDCTKEFEKLYNRKYNIEKVTAITATELSASLREKLMKKLQAQTGKKIILECIVDSSIMGGIVLRTQNSQTDASVRSRLDAIKNQLASSEV